MEGEAGEAEDSGFPVAGKAFDAGSLSGGQRDRGDAGAGRLAAAGGQRRTAGVNLQVSGIYNGRVRRAGGVLARGRGGGEDACVAREGGLDGGGPELGERGQRGMPADRVVCPGLGLVPGRGPPSPF